MSQDNPEAGDVFYIPMMDHRGFLVYYLVNSADDKLAACWFTAGCAPMMRPAGGYPQPGDKYLCSINKLFRSIEEKLSNAAANS